jgi:putative membrane protein
MFTLFARWVLNALALYIVAQIIPGIRLMDFVSALVAVAVIAAVNVFIKPLLLIVTLPITILTLGLFAFIINAILLLLASRIVPGFIVDGFGAALLGSILFSVISTTLHSLAR